MAKKKKKPFLNKKRFAKKKLGENEIRIPRILQFSKRKEKNIYIYIYIYIYHKKNDFLLIIKYLYNKKIFKINFISI